MAQTQNFLSYQDANTLFNKVGRKLEDLKGAYIWKGNSTFENIPSVPLISMVGWIYTITNDFTTDNRFSEGSGVECSAGTEIGIVNLGTSAVTNVKFRIMTGSSDIEPLTNEQKDNIIDILDN